MNINKKKFIRKTFIFSKIIFTSVGGFVLVPQMGCSWVQKKLGILEEDKKDHSLHTCKVEQEHETGYMILSENQIRNYLDHGTEVYSEAYKFVIYIPKLEHNGNPPVYTSSHKKVGQKILDYKSDPIDYNGILFTNPKDNCDQFVRGDGTDVIIINQPTEKQIDEVIAKMKDLNFSLDKLSIEKVEQLIAYFAQIGITDCYDSNVQYINTKCKETYNNSVNKDNFCGLYKRNDQQNNEFCKAVYIEGLIKFHGSATAGPQIFLNGAVIVKHGNDIRAVQPAEFEATYKDKNGNNIKVTELQKVVLIKA